MEVVIFDVDNTIVNGQSQGELVKYLREKKMITNYTFGLLILWVFLYKFGLVKNPLRPMEYGVSFIKGKSEKEVKELIDDFFEARIIKMFYPKALELIKDHIKSGRRVILVSNSLDVVVGKICEFLDVKDYISTKLEKNHENIYTGKIFGEIMYGKRKREAVIEYLKQKNLIGSKLWSYGDHDSDIDLLSYVDKPFAVNPTKKLKDMAIKNNWTILNF